MEPGRILTFSAPTAETDDDDSPKRKAGAATTTSSQWHRMKWTATMVKLLIMAVYYIGDETASSDDVSAKKNTTTTTDNSKATSTTPKGKWKAVSRAMVEKGHSVSPQQCEDKFNDLNKRYKRVNEILGKGTACRVVEDHSLLESMDHLSIRKKEEARKLLDSKHLFFREMCAYHNSCPSSHHHRDEPLEYNNKDQNPSHREEEEEEEWEELDWEEGVSGERKRGREEVERVVGEGGKTAAEKRRWVRWREVELEEEGVRCEEEGLEIERERWKWVRFSRRKETEFERKIMENHRSRVENQRMLLLLKQKELEIV